MAALNRQKEIQKIVDQKCAQILNELLRSDDNKYCVDCDSKGPRWASWNLGVFLCIRCAGIHRNMGVHISRVKSVNLDAWTPEQVTNMQMMGNSRARAVYEASLPDNFRRPNNDTGMESFIRAKYELKKYIAKEWIPPPIPSKVDWSNEAEEILKRRKRGQLPGGVASLPVPVPPPTTPVAAQLKTQTGSSAGSKKSVEAKKGVDVEGNTKDQPAPCSHATPKSGGDIVDLLGIVDSSPPVTTTADSSGGGGGGLLELMSSDFGHSGIVSPSEKESSKDSSSGDTKSNLLSKESILALYGPSKPTVPLNMGYVIGGGGQTSVLGNNGNSYMMQPQSQFSQGMPGNLVGNGGPTFAGMPHAVAPSMAGWSPAPHQQYRYGGPNLPLTNAAFLGANPFVNPPTGSMGSPYTPQASLGPLMPSPTTGLSVGLSQQMAGMALSSSTSSTVSTKTTSLENGGQALTSSLWS